MKIRTITLILATAMSLAIVSCGPKDSDVKAKIESVITDPGVTVAVEDGVVTLSGTVADEEAKMALETKAKGAKGVNSVVNNVTVVAPVEVAADPALEQAVKDAIKDVPTVEFTITDGEVSLTGTATQEQKRTIQQAVSAANPKKINNNIVVN